jgi:NAD(P)H dehydrogenase (quinone)
LNHLNTHHEEEGNLSGPGVSDSKQLPVLAVVGAAGLSGSHLLEALRPAPLRVRAVVHGPAGRERAAAHGADETAEADLAEPGSVRSALAGADIVFMIPPAFHPEEDAFAITAMQAAEDAGARRFVYLSVLHPHTPGLRHHMRKAKAEVALRASDLDWTILQPSMFAQIIWATCGKAPPGRVPVPYDVTKLFSLIDLRDLAEVGVKVVTEPGHDAATYEVAGPAITLSEAVRTVGRARDAELEAQTVAWTEAPVPPPFADRPSAAADMRAMWQEYDQHGLRGNSNILRMLLGREPASFDKVATVLAEHG